MSNQDILDALEGTEIAVVGMAGRYPGAQDIETFWRNLRDGVESVTFYSDEELRAADVHESLLSHPNYIKSGAPLDDMEKFDASFFGFGPRDAAIMDPQHRNFLEISWAALEHAGYDAERFDGAIGVFGGSGHNAYMPYNLLTNPELVASVGFFLLRHTGNDKDFLTTRVSYLMNLRGPSVNVQTACSTSLVAIHMAAQSLLSGECDIALAGGVTIEMPHRQGYIYQDGEILSSDGHCRAFDADSDGTIFGSGVGVVTLRRLADAIEDGDTIHAVIKGSAINNDGSGKVNYLAPSVDGQAGAIAEAIALANIDADTIDYVEAHGTGTRIGDPIEVTALTQAFRQSTDKTQFCGLGTVKTNIGHLDTAAGVAAFTKVVQALKNKQIPATLNYQSPNPMLELENGPFFVNDKLRDWPRNGSPRRAGVSSLGVGGTNAHIVLEEAPELEPSSASRAWQLLQLSAKTGAALDAASQKLATFLQENPDVLLADVAYTLQVGRQPMAQRRIVAVRDAADAVEALASGNRKRLVTQQAGDAAPSVVFMFPGGGAQYPNMGRDLYEAEPVYRQAIDESLSLLRPFLSTDLRQLIFPEVENVEQAAEALKRPSLNLPAIFMTEYALAQLWLSWGIAPAAMTGHSMGEYTAACLAGVLSLKDALFIVTLRGKLFETLPEGGMVSVPMTEADLQPYLTDGLSIAVINNPELCVVSGEVAAIEKLEAVLAEKEVEYRRVRINVAAHSPMLDPILDEFGRELAKIQFNPPAMPFISNVTGKWITAEEATDPQYWVRHLRHTVRFADGLSTLMQEPNRLFLEVGPGQTLNALVRMHPDKEKTHTAVASLRHRKEELSDLQFALTSLGRLWLAGVMPDWAAFYGDEVRYRLPLPTYPFERQRYWIDPGTTLFNGAEATETVLAKMPELANWFYKRSWQLTDMPTAVVVEPLTWLLFKDKLGVGEALQQQLRGSGHTVISVTVGEQFRQLGEFAYEVNPRARIDYDTLVEELTGRSLLPQRLAHLWTLNHSEKDETPMQAYYKNQDLGFFSLFFLAQALGEEGLPSTLDITAVSNGTQRVDDEAVPYPDKATLLGPIKVMPREFPGVSCRLIDLPLPVQTNGQLAQDLASLLKQDLLAAPENGLFAYRNGRRWQQTFEAAPQPEGSLDDSRIKQGGVTIITGGMGGIGLVMAEHLAETAQAKLVLLSRSGLPKREMWPDWVKNHSAHDRTSRRIQKIQALEETGAEVLVIQADITNREQVKQAVAQAKKRFGAIDGVIHAAGVLDDNLIQLKTAQEAGRVLAPKARGALLLDEYLADEPLDFFVLFSSTSTEIGAAGQVDYVAANAFLNAFAESKTAVSNTFTVAVNWGVWQEVGMAVDTAVRLGMVDDSEPIGTDVPHPLLDKIIVETENEIVYTTDYRIDTHWILDQHRIKDGEALIPGTGYLEIAKAAMEKGMPNGPIEIQDLFFLAPLEVHEDESREVRVSLEKNGMGYGFSVTSRTEEYSWQEHVRGKVLNGRSADHPPQNIQEIAARCTVRELNFGLMEQETKQEAYLDFGPRWKNLRQVCYGENEVLAMLELPEQFSDDLDSFTLHPALMDLATSAGLPLVEGYETSKDFYVPLSYKKVQVHGRLPRRIYSHVRHNKDGRNHQEVPAFDVTIMDENGRSLVEINEFMLKRVSYETMIGGGKKNGAGKTAVAHDSEPTLLQLALTDGIAPSEGMEALRRILSNPVPPQMIVTSLDLHGLVAQADSEQAADDESGGLKLSRPELQTSYEAPRNDLEKNLAKFWEELLGITDIGIDDDFFELGGHSLIAVRLFSKIKKMYAVDLSLATLFEAPTIGECAELLQEDYDVPAEVTQETDQPKVKKRRRASGEWSPLVAIQPKGSKTPFFCVHGGFGNVLNFYDLTRYLGPDQPFYGLQARGVDGKRPPFGTLEEMAAEYVKQIRTVQPEGPYMMGGFSMGGEVAYEMAQQLQAAGQKVVLVALLDTHNPEYARRRNNILRQSEGPESETAVTGVELSESGGGLKNKLRMIKRWAFFRYRFARMDTEKHLLYWRCRSYLRSGKTLPQTLISPFLWKSHIDLVYGYGLKSYPGRVTLFRASETEVSNPNGEGIGWAPFAQAGLDVKIVHGTHNIVKEPYVAELARLLKLSIDKAIQNSG
ncbi:Polyketide synthase modules and related proteins [hydrothermal vent metagenome]|uniref:Polyketide synthase modules and related proteins n=1 Tax=hydrothermal vent metagenome TaxID=652676 RepID=A0A3B0V771_9ZZZZ